MHLRNLLLVAALVPLSGCLTMSGSYNVKAVDANGNELGKGLKMMAQGRHIYTARNALCSNYPKATIIITDLETGQELKGESPYRCR